MFKVGYLFFTLTDLVIFDWKGRLCLIILLDGFFTDERLTGSILFGLELPIIFADKRCYYAIH